MAENNSTSNYSRRFSDNDEITKLENNDLLVLTQDSSNNDKNVSYAGLKENVGRDIFSDPDKFTNMEDNAATELGKKAYLGTEKTNIVSLINQKYDEKIKVFNDLHDAGYRDILTDGNGLEDDMFWFPKFKCEDLCPDGELGTGTHPAFIIKDPDTGELREIDGFWVGRYHASKDTTKDANGIPVSKPGIAPWCSISWEDSRTMCEKKNKNGVTGYHMINAWEWAAIALWANKFGYDDPGCASGFPGGADQTTYSQPEYDNPFNSHNGKYNGIMCMKGNCWDWVDLCKTTTDSKLLIPDYNAVELQNVAGEASWNLIDQVLPDTAGGGGMNTFNTKFRDFGKDLPADVYLKLKRVAMTTMQNFRFCGGYWITKNQESVLLMGGRSNLGSLCGLEAISLGYHRVFCNNVYGFRFSKIDY